MNKTEKTNYINSLKKDLESYNAMMVYHYEGLNVNQLDELRDKIKANGMRNSNTLAIAPTATISNICGVSQSIEPTYQNLYVKSNLSGEFTVINPYLINDLKSRDLWDEVMIKDLKYFDGEPVIKELKRISTPGRRVYTNVKNIPKVRQGLGIAIISTPKGVMSDSKARATNVGGEILCTVF